MKSWKETTLKEVSYKPEYGYTASSIENDTGVKFLRITDIVPDSIDWNTVPYCEISDLDCKKYKLSKDDIVIARTGATVGYAKQITNDDVNSVFASYLIRVKVKNEYSKEYIGILVGSSNYKYFIKTVAGGSAQPNANAKVLTLYPFYLPPSEIQKKIAAILTSYDSLISNNRRRIKLLENIAEEIFREWFVRFRFPEYQNAPFEKGIPKEWDIKSIKEIIDRKRFGRIYRESELIGEGEIIVLDQSKDDYLGFYDGEAEHKASIKEPVVLFGDHTCKMVLVMRNFSLAENVIPFVPRYDMPIYFLFHLIKNKAKTTEYKRHWTELITQKVFIPNNSLQIQFSEKVIDIYRQIQILKEATINLCKTKDLLLPRLISGKLSVEHLDIQFPPSMLKEEEVA